MPTKSEYFCHLCYLHIEECLRIHAVSWKGIVLPAYYLKHDASRRSNGSIQFVYYFLNVTALIRDIPR